MQQGKMSPVTVTTSGAMLLSSYSPTRYLPTSSLLYPLAVTYIVTSLLFFSTMQFKTSFECFYIRLVFVHVFHESRSIKSGHYTIIRCIVHLGISWWGLFLVTPILCNVSATEVILQTHNLFQAFWDATCFSHLLNRRLVLKIASSMTFQNSEQDMSIYII